MQKIGIFGGTFNPVHAEHVSVAVNAVKELNLDKILIMPTFMPPHKNTTPAPAVDRLNMLKLAFDKVEKAEISTYEIEKEGKSYTYQTVEHFKDKDVTLYFICGGDMLTDFKTWKYPERILNACTLAVFDREGYFTDYKAESEYFSRTFNKSFIKLSYVGKQVSSTKIRVYSAFGFSVQGLTLPAVTEYILKNGLYCNTGYVEYLKEHLTEKRLLHTANVATLALQKVKELNLDAEKVLTASILHDVAKYLDYKDFDGFTLPPCMPEPVIHAYLGAFVAEHVLGVKDKEILDAIKYHTSGRANMSKLEKLIFTADMLEEGRTYEGVEILREFYKKDLDTCFIECLKEEYLHLLRRGGDIYFETISAFNYYVKGE